MYNESGLRGVGVTRLLRAGFLFFALFACSPSVREVRPQVDVGLKPEERSTPAPQASPSDAERPVVPPAREMSLAEGAETAPPPVERKLAHLHHFYDAIDALRAGQRDRSVRILWLGDSHTAADFMTQPVREHLVRLGGDGGPGFVRLGLDGYRHGAAHVKSFGRWRKAPILPAQRTRVLDGVFGYGGIRTLPAAAAGAIASVRVATGRELVWTLSARLPPGARVDLKLGEAKLRASSDAGNTEAGGAQFVSLTGPDTEEFNVLHVGGDPEVFGVFADYSAPGVVLDTVGINGARTATPLAWEPEQYVAQVNARSPDLLVLAFGTNEVFDQTRPDRYVEHNTKLVELIRQARPEISCWIVGPPDSSTMEGTSKARVFEVTAAQKAAAEQLGCAFTSAFELMGGEGSFNRWAREKPAKSRGDRVHFTIAGYRALGEYLASALIGGVPRASQQLSVEEPSVASDHSPAPAETLPPQGDAPTEPHHEP